MIVLGCILACFSGFVAIAYAMDRHHRDMTGFAVKGRRGIPAIKAGGWLLLFLAALPMCRTFGVGVGLAFWAGLLMASALAVASGLTYRPRVLPAAALTAVPLSLCAVLFPGVP